MDKINSKTDTMQVQVLHDENNAIVNPGETRLPFAIANGNGAGLSQSQLEQIANAESLDFDMKGETWSPLNVGERKRLVYQQLVKGELVANKFGNSPDELVPVDCAYFVELYHENNAFKQRMVRSFATVVVSFLERNRVPKHAVLDIEYKGKKKGTTFMFDDFKFIPVPVKFEEI
jgi:hypothetical protein